MNAHERFGTYTCPFCGSENLDDLTQSNFECEVCGEEFSWLEVDWSDGLTADDRNTFADCVEDALMHEHPANVAQAVERGIDEELPYPLVFRGEVDEVRPYRPASLILGDDLPF